MRYAFLLLSLLTSPGFAASKCDQRNAQAENLQARLVPPFSFQVIGAGRLQFYSAPDAACKKHGVFVIPGDQLIGYGEYEHWVSVMYFNPKTGTDAQGWVDSRRLKYRGTMGQ